MKNISIRNVLFVDFQEGQHLNDVKLFLLLFSYDFYLAEVQFTTDYFFLLFFQ